MIHQKCSKSAQNHEIRVASVDNLLDENEWKTCIHTQNQLISLDLFLWFEHTFWNISRLQAIFFPKQLIRTGCCIQIIIMGRMRQVFCGNLYQMKVQRTSYISSNSLLTLVSPKTECKHRYFVVKLELKQQTKQNKSTPFTKFTRDE